MTQDIGFDLLVQLPLYRDGQQVYGKEGPSFLLIKIVVVADSTKTLLKYHPEVDINLQLDVEHLLETLSVKKSQLPLWRMAFLGILSGVWMAISGCFAFAVAGKLPPMSCRTFLTSLQVKPANSQVGSTRTSCAPHPSCRAWSLASSPPSPCTSSSSSAANSTVATACASKCLYNQFFI
jgi:hypothetical protein